MLKIHEKSPITTVADLDIFSLPPTQASIEKTYYSEHRPLSTISSNQQIQFNIKTSKDEYINLRDSLFYIKLKINLSKSTNVVAADWEKIIPVNNLLHSLFKNIHLEINNKNISRSPPNYAYKAYFESLLGFTETAKVGLMSAQGWQHDFDTKISTFTKNNFLTPKTIDVSGVGKSIELMGKLHLDYFMQPKSLVGGCDIILTLEPNDPSFYVWIDGTAVSAKAVFEESAFYVSRSKVNDSVVRAHNHILEKSNAKYPIMRGIVKSFPVSSGLSDVNIDNAIVGQIPRRIFLAMVDSRGYNGDQGHNPYNFQHFDLNSLTASLEGEIFPTISFRPNFADNLYVKEFINLYDTMNQLSTDSSLTISMEDFKKGLAIFGMSFAPDPIDDCNKTGYWNLVRNGSINLNLKFKNPLTNNINVIIYCEYDNLIEIDKTRTPICDFI